MKKYIIYIAILAAGLILGYVFFGNSNDGASKANTSEVSESSVKETQMWTCSMHPQIMQPEPGDCPICGMDLIPAESGAEGLAVNEIKMTDNAMALANIQTMVVGNASEVDGNTLSLSGKIMPNEEANAVQASYFEGRIEKLNVSFTGEKVNKGQLLATIYAPALVAAQQELLTAASMKESQPALYKAVRNKLKLWKLSDSQIDAIESSGKVRENFPIYATVSGTVSEKLVEQGDYVTQGQPMVKVSNLQTVWAMLDVYENQISQLRKGQKIAVTTNAYPDKEFEATISFIDPQLNTQSRTVSVRATLNNKEGILKPGMFVTTKVQMSKDQQNTQQVIVPASAVLWTGNRSLVYVKNHPNQPVFEMREVGLGAKTGDNYSITDGLSNGEEVVVNGTFTVDAAAQLQGKKSMMNQNESIADEVSMTDMKMQLSGKVQNMFKSSIKPYLQMKDAFVASDAKKVSAAAKSTLQKINSIPESELGIMEKSHFAQIKKMLAAIAESNDIKNQRQNLVILNENMIPMIINIDAPDQQLYIQNCPMANNDKGASWISKEKEIRNPYYGDAMLTCGSVVDSIQ